MAKRLYPDVAIFTVNNSIYAVSDKLYPLKALAIIKFFHLNGTLLNFIEKEVELQINEAKVIYKIDSKEYKDAPQEESMIYTEIIAGKNQGMSSTYFNTKFQGLKLFPAEIEVTFFS